MQSVIITLDVNHRAVGDDTVRLCEERHSLQAGASTVLITGSLAGAHRLTLLRVCVMPPRGGAQARVIDSGSEDDPEPEGGRSARRQADKGWTSLSEEAQDEYVGKIMRYMLCRHAVKAPVKRVDLSKYLFEQAPASSGRASIFAGALKGAQENFRTTLGCEMVEVFKQTRPRSSGVSQTKAMTQLAVASHGGAGGSSQPGQVAGSQAGQGNGTKAFILVSTLPQDARAENESEFATRAFLTIIAGLILLEPSCRISEEDLKRALSRAAGIDVVESKGHAQLNGGNVKDLLEKQLVSQWYLEREKEDGQFYYSLGPRLRAELDDEDLIAFIDAVFSQGTTSSMDITSQKELKQKLDAARGVISEDTDDDDESD
jgi:MAGE family